METPVLEVDMLKTNQNHLRSGVFVLWKMVPAVMEA
jgi:hypothetical protein